MPDKPNTKTRNTVGLAVLISVLVVGTVVAGWYHSSSHSDALLARSTAREVGYQTRIAALEKELREKTGALSTQVTGLRRQIHQLMQTADGLWQHASNPPRDASASQAETAYRTFVSKFPEDRRVPEARRRIAQLQKQQMQATKAAMMRRREEKRTREEENLVAQLSEVTVQQIYAEPGKYRRKVIDRTLSCGQPSTASAALFSHDMSCWVEGDMSQDIRVGLSTRQLKAVAGLRRRGARLVGKLRVKIIDREPTGSGIVAKLVDVLESDGQTQE